MPFTPDQEHAIALIAQNYAANKIEAQVSRSLRWIHITATILGISGIAGLFAAFAWLPDAAAQKVIERFSFLSSKLDDFVQRAVEAEGAAQRAQKAASVASAEAEAAHSAATTANETRLRLDELDLGKVAGGAATISAILSAEEGTLQFASMLEHQNRIIVGSVRAGGDSTSESLRFRENGGRYAATRVVRFEPAYRKPPMVFAALRGVIKSSQAAVQVKRVTATEVELEFTTENRYATIDASILVIPIEGEVDFGETQHSQNIGERSTVRRNIRKHLDQSLVPQP